VLSDVILIENLMIKILLVVTIFDE